MALTVSLQWLPWVKWSQGIKVVHSRESDKDKRRVGIDYNMPKPSNGKCPNCGDIVRGTESDFWVQAHCHFYGQTKELNPVLLLWTCNRCNSNRTGDAHWKVEKRQGNTFWVEPTIVLPRTI